MRTIGVKLAAMGVATLMAYQASAVIAYDTPASTAGNQGSFASGLDLGMRFTANQSITVTSLGVFDSGLDGFGASTITVGIYDVSSPASPLGFASFTGTAGTLAPGSAYRFLPAGFSLTAGQTYMIVASGLGTTSNPDYNANGIPTVISANNGGGAITFLPNENYYNIRSGGSPALAYPTTLDLVGNVSGNAIGRYGAGSFEFAVPEAKDFAMAGVGLLALVYFGRCYLLRGKLA